MFENVVILIATMVMDNLMTLLKWEQILSLFNQVYYFTKYCVLGVSKCCYINWTMVIDDLMTLVKWEEI